MSLDVRFVEQARRVLTALLAANPELEEDDVLRLDMVEGETSAMELLDELIRAERDAVALMGAVAEEQRRLDQRLERFSVRRVAIRKYIMQLMEAANLKKAERPAATVSIAAGRPKVIITDETAIPPAYTRTKVEIDKESIAKTLKALGEVPGATLSNAEPYIRIS
jgi:hypothetical protein